jgi:hypothetical protein
MAKYLIEDNINFYSELHKSLDENESNLNNEEEDNNCLITSMPLKDYYITMECGHKFNYIPLFKDIENHKKNFNNMEGTSGKLGKNEIRCPYCRKKQTTLLPYYENICIPKTPGINVLYPNVEYKINNQNCGQCEYEILDSSGNVYHNKKCGLYGSTLCPNKYGANYGDAKKYCWNHTKIIIKKYKQEIKNKKIADEKHAKEGLKKANKYAKEQAKLKAKEDKKNSKKSGTKPENIVLSISNVIASDNISEIEPDTETTNFVKEQESIAFVKLDNCCVSILKTGLNKGNCCGGTIYDKETKLCKRHFNKMK